MIKILLLLALASWGCKRFAGRWPWQIWLDWDRQGMNGGSMGGGGMNRHHFGGHNVSGQAKAQARALLGVPFAASRNEILDAHKRLIARVHPDRGGSTDLVHEANGARDLLLADLPVRSG